MVPCTGMCQDSGDYFAPESVFCKFMGKLEKASLEFVLTGSIPSQSAKDSYGPPVDMYRLTTVGVEGDAKLTGFTVRCESDLLPRECA